MQSNVLYYGDNLDILRRYIKDETVDLVAGKKIEYPPTNITFKDAPRAERGTKKTELGL